MTASKITTQAEWDELHVVMATDSHACFAPTHILRSDAGEIAGAFSTFCAPVLFFWMHSGIRNPIMAAHGYALAEKELRAMGMTRILVFLEHSSPFYPFLERTGFRSLGEVTAFAKELAK